MKNGDACNPGSTDLVGPCEGIIAQVREMALPCVDADLGGGVIRQRMRGASLKLLTLVAKNGLGAVA